MSFHRQKRESACSQPVDGIFSLPEHDGGAYNQLIPRSPFLTIQNVQSENAHHAGGKETGPDGIPIRRTDR